MLFSLLGDEADHVEMGVGDGVGGALLDPDAADFARAFTRWGKRQTWEETVAHRYVELEASREGDTMCLMRLGRFLGDIRPMKPMKMEAKQLQEIVGDDARAAFLREHHKINSPATTPYYLAQLDCRAHFGSGRRSLQDLTSQVWQRILATHIATLPRTLPELPDLLAHVSYQPLLFLGPAGTETPLHQDPHPNFFVQVVGCKFFRLIPDSSETVGEGNVVQRCAEPGRSHFARNSEEVMRKKHLLANRGIEESDKEPECFNIDVILKPGDCLFIPKGCWHYVKSLTASVSLSYMVGEGDEDHFPSWRTLCSGAYPDDPYVD
eukprot:g17513.t1